MNVSRRTLLTTAPSVAVASVLMPGLVNAAPPVTTAESVANPRGSLPIPSISPSKIEQYNRFLSKPPRPQTETVAKPAKPPTLAERLEMGQFAKRLDAWANRAHLLSVCRVIDDSQEVELYDGTLGVSKDYVRKLAPSVLQLQWLDDLAARYSGSGNNAGDVSGARWGSGALIGPDLVLTAGHCFDQDPYGWTVPTRSGKLISPQDIAREMKVNFDYQINAKTGQLRPEVSFPVVELVEYRTAMLDYAIIRVGKNVHGKLPGMLYPVLSVAKTTPAAPEMLCAIQHPDGRPKRVEAGPLTLVIDEHLAYDDIDTLGGSSGAPLLGQDGAIAGVHVLGGCDDPAKQVNRGVSLARIRAVSKVLKA